MQPTATPTMPVGRSQPDDLLTDDELDRAARGGMTHTVDAGYCEVCHQPADGGLCPTCERADEGLR